MGVLDRRGHLDAVVLLGQWVNQEILVRRVIQAHKV